MILTDFKCHKCGHVWTVGKGAVMDEFVVAFCPNCRYKKQGDDDKTIHRIWKIGAIDIAEGHFGTGKNGFKSKGDGFYHPSKFGRYKGIRV